MQAAAPMIETASTRCKVPIVTRSSRVHRPLNLTQTKRCRAFVLAAILAAATLLVGACGDDEDAGAGGAAPVPATHIHGLGVNPADGALFIATHHGLFRAAEGSSESVPVGEDRQDTMGFTVAGPDHFLGSGHPAPTQPGPTSLGLIESTDGGETWESISLSGEADFHVLRFAHDRVYGFDALTGVLSISTDGGETWAVRTPPANPVLDLIVDPTDPDQLVAASGRGLWLSSDGARRWRPLSPKAGLLAWPSPDELLLVDFKGRVQASNDGGETWRTRGEIGESPAAFLAESDRRLYAAGSDGTVMESDDGGESWRVRVRA